MGHAAGQEDVNDRLGRALLLLARLAFRARLKAKEIVERQTQSADHADVQKSAPARPTEMGWVVIPGSLDRTLHDTISSWGGMGLGTALHGRFNYRK